MTPKTTTLEGLLESVAREIVQQPLGSTYPITRHVLKRRLLPLLEAGKNGRNWMACLTRQKFFDIGDAQPKCVIEYDAALREAGKEKP